MSDKVWCRFWTGYDAFKQINPGHYSVETVYRSMIRTMGARGGVEGQNMACEILAQYVYKALGSHTWFVDKELGQSMLTAKVDDDMRGLRIPYDSMVICFEKGFEIEPGVPLRAVLLFAPRSKVTAGVVEKVAMIQNPLSLGDTLTFYMDTGDNVETKVMSHDTPGLKLSSWHWARKYESENLLGIPNNLTENETRLVFKIVKIVCACLILYSARPEYVASFQLSRSQRFQFGDAETRKNFKRIILPGLKQQHVSSSHEPTGRTVAGHYRGWVYRVLRSERYTRNPDGTFKTVVVPPCVVKGGPEEED